MSESLRTIAVDFTPILPHGENGGAKIFVLELLRYLTKAAPQVRFVLLTQASLHDELGALDRDNVERLLVFNAPSPLRLARLFPATDLAETRRRRPRSRHSAKSRHGANAPQLGRATQRLRKQRRSRVRTVQ
jgi:hypothetical protein